MPTGSTGEWPSGKAPDSGSGDRRFESFLASQTTTSRAQRSAEPPDVAASTSLGPRAEEVRSWLLRLTTPRFVRLILLGPSGTSLDSLGPIPHRAGRRNRPVLRRQGCRGSVAADGRVVPDDPRPGRPPVRQRSSVGSRCTAKQPPRGAMCLAARTTYLWSAASLEMPSSVRTVAPAARPVTAPWSAVAASASGNVAPTWSDSSPSASAATRTASRAPSART